MARATVFPFYVQPYAGWRHYGWLVRKHADRIMGILREPCAGYRLRQPPFLSSAPPPRWDEFCKVDLPDNYRVIYRWDPLGFITIEIIGPHKGAGVLKDVYEALRQVHGLPPDPGHAQQGAERCCERELLPLDERSVPEAQARQTLLRLAAR